MVRIESRFRRSHRTNAPAMTRFRFSSPSDSLSYRFSRLALIAALFGVACGAHQARADEFSLLPLGDPIYAQLSSLSRPADAKADAKAIKPDAAGALTRYEAALQAARAILDAQNRDPKTVSRAHWRAIKALCVSLKSELKQLGVDVEAARFLADRNLKADVKVDATTSVATNPTVSTPRAATAPAPGTGPRASNLGGGLLMAGPSLGSRGVQSKGLEIPITAQLRGASSLLELQQPNTLNGGAAATGAAALGGAASLQDAATLAAQNQLAGTLGSQTSLAFDFSSYLTLRAATSQRRLGVAGADSPLLLGPLFEGATRSSAAGGGLDVNMGALKLSTDLERLRTDTGAGASRIGGGASLSALGNRLSLGANWSRLLPEDKTILPSTAAQLGLGFDVTQRFRLNMLYQGLFAQTAQNSASRVSGGISLSF